MIRKSSLLAFLFFISLALGVHVTAQDGDDSPLSDLPSEGELYRPMAFRVNVDPDTYQNPFDDTDIEVIGIFRAPSGEESVVRGFWLQPYRDPCPTCAAADLVTDGDPIWQIRFTPREVGLWSYRLQVRDNGTAVVAQDGQFEVFRSDRPGFIRAGRSSRYFRYDSGAPYFPVGYNLNYAWDEIGGLHTYLRWLKQLSDAGGSYARLFIDLPWFISVDWARPAGDYRESQRAAAMLDLILEAAAEYGVALQIVILWHQSMQFYNGPPVNIPQNPPRPATNANWDGHPYNVFNGGPLSGPGVFLYNEQALTLFRRRLRYIAARWGSSPQIFAWELVDRIDRLANYNPETAARWLQTMISYLREIDPYDHLITAGSAGPDPLTAANPLLDFTMSQLYQRRPIEEAPDQVSSVANLVQRYLQWSPSPTLLADFSLNPWFEPLADDPLGVHVQISMWAAALSGAAGGAASDWWHTYVIPQDFMRFCGPLAAFAGGIDWPNLDLRPASAGFLTSEPSDFAPLRITQFNRQFAARLEDVVTRSIGADGVFPPVENVPSFLYGRVFNSQFSQVQRYTVAPAVDTYLEVGVRAVSSQAGARLVVAVDGSPAAELALRRESAATAVRIPIKAGDHTITLENTGEDWLEIDYLEVGQLIAPARALTLRDTTAGVALAWIQHRDYTWQKVNAGEPRQSLQLQYRLYGMPAGRYVAEIWDPLSGAVLGEELVTVAGDGVLALDLLPMDSQLAIRAVRQGDALPPSLVPVETPRQNTAEATATPAVSPTRPPRPVLAQTNTPRPTEGPIP